VRFSIGPAGGTQNIGISNIRGGGEGGQSHRVATTGKCRLGRSISCYIRGSSEEKVR
jgi:hypothetical protein